MPAYTVIDFYGRIRQQQQGSYFLVIPAERARHLMRESGSSIIGEQVRVVVTL